MSTTAAPGPTLAVDWLGRMDYIAAWERQRELHARRADGDTGDTLLLLEHEPVFTAGKRTEAWERPVDGAPVVDVDRGGRITWHGPGQLTGYPIVALPEPVDVVAFVRLLEAALIEVCAAFGVAGRQMEGRSGVWLPADPDAPFDGGRPERKVAAIGLRVARGVTMHGFALNCDCSLDGFDAIVPCGLPDAGVTTLSLESGRAVTVEAARPVVVDAMQRHLLRT